MYCEGIGGGGKVNIDQVRNSQCKVCDCPALGVFVFHVNQNLRKMYEQMSAEQKKVSIIVPVYNTGKRLWKCVESLVAQTYSNKEILIIDDGSDKACADLCDALMKKYMEVTVYHYKNEGVSAARNHGIDRAQGSYICFADGDDYTEPDMLKCMVENMEEQNGHLVVTGYFFDVPKRKKDRVRIFQKSQYLSSKTLSSPEEIKKEMVHLWDSSLMYNVWNKLFRASIIRKNMIRFPEEKVFNEDRDFVREYLLNIENMVIVEECFYHYVREDKSTATGQYRPEMLDIRKEEFHRLECFFRQLGIYDEEGKEYTAREHFDRIVGTIENIFHCDDMDRKNIKQEIRRILDDSDTKNALRNSKPKSKKMMLLHVMFRTNNSELIYWTMLLIYKIRIKNPEIFYLLRQSR